MPASISGRGVLTRGVVSMLRHCKYLRGAANLASSCRMENAIREADATTQPDAVERCFGCKNRYSLSQLVACEGLLVCRRRCAERREVFELGGSAVLEIVG